MKVTDVVISHILSAIRSKDISQTTLAKETGLGKSWVSRFLSGQIKYLKAEHAEKLEEILEIQITPKKSGVATEVSGLALDVSQALDSSPDLAPLLSQLLDFISKNQKEPPAKLTPKFFETKEMSRIGDQIIRICFANEDKPGKVAREVLKLVSE